MLFEVIIGVECETCVRKVPYYSEKGEEPLDGVVSETGKTA